MLRLMENGETIFSNLATGLKVTEIGGEVRTMRFGPLNRTELFKWFDYRLKDEAVPQRLMKAVISSTKDVRLALQASMTRTVSTVAQNTDARRQLSDGLVGRADVMPVWQLPWEGSFVWFSQPLYFASYV